MKKLVSIFVTVRLYLLAIPLALNFTGSAMNQMVLAANGGKFPVMINEYSAGKYAKDNFLDDIHCVMTSETHLNWLADFINMHTAIYSPGDMLIELGELLPYAAVAWAALIINDASLRQKAKKQCVYCEQ